MTTTQLTPVEPGNRIYLPSEWVKALRLQGMVLLDKTDEGILVRPCPPASWDDVFATKLPIGQTSPESQELEIHTDDLFL
jgi:hypothetical protein